MPRTKLISDDDVLSRAREVLLCRGASVSTAEIAKHVGLSQATLFQRFGSKNALLTRALRPEPINPISVIGAPEECTDIGVQAHLVLIAERLFDAIIGVMQRLQVVTAAGMMNPEMSELAHNFAESQKLISAIVEHLETLEEIQGRAKLMTSAITMMVHGAIAQSLQNHDFQKSSARSQLGDIVRLMKL